MIQVISHLTLQCGDGVHDTLHHPVVSRRVRLTYYEILGYIILSVNHRQVCTLFVSLIMLMLPDAHFDDPLLNDAFDFSRYPTFKTRNARPPTVRFAASLITPRLLIDSPSSRTS